MAVFDVKQRRENELFEAIVSSRPEDSDVRLEAMSELTSRHNFQDQTACFHGVIAAAKKFGISAPEGSMLSEMLSNILYRSPELFDVFLSTSVGESRNRYFAGFAARFVKSLGPSQKEKAIPALVTMLFQQDSIDLPSEAIIDTLTAMETEGLSDKVTSEVLSKTSSPNGLRVLLATRVLAKTAAASAIEEMLLVLDRTLAEWYGPLKDQVQDQVILYLTRSPSDKALPRIEKVILLRRTGILMQMFHGFYTRRAAELLEKFIQESTGEIQKRDLADWCVMAIAQMQPNLIDLRKLVSCDALFQKYWNARFYIKTIFLALKEQGKPILIELLKDPNWDKYSFGAECLGELGVSVDEMSRIVGESPSSELYSFFYPKETLEEIWSHREVNRLGGQVGNGTKRFDLFIIEILSAFNFQVLYVDSSRKQGVDIIGLSPSGNHMIVAGATIESLKDDLGKLTVTLGEMKEKMKALVGRHNVIPVIFSASEKPVTDDDLNSARRARIVVLGRAEVENLMKMARTGRTSQDLVQLLTEKYTTLSMPPMPSVY